MAAVQKRLGPGESLDVVESHERVGDSLGRIDSPEVGVARACVFGVIRSAATYHSPAAANPHMLLNQRTLVSCHRGVRVRELRLLTRSHVCASAAQLCRTTGRVANQHLGRENSHVNSIYHRDLSYIHAAAFESIAKGAARETASRLRNCTTNVQKVLDVGCGAGPLTKALLEAGFDVTGTDSSAEMLELARGNVPKARFLYESAYEVDVRGYDAVVAVGEPLTYHADHLAADNLVSSLFRRVGQTIPTGGMFIFDVIGLGEPSLTGRSWKSGDDWAMLVETFEDQTERKLIRNIETFRRVDGSYRRGREVHSVRLFDVSELREQLGSHGFVIETAQSYGSQPLPPRRHAFFATRSPSQFAQGKPA